MLFTERRLFELDVALQATDKKVIFVVAHSSADEKRLICPKQKEERCFLHVQERGLNVLVCN